MKNRWPYTEAKRHFCLYLPLKFAKRRPLFVYSDFRREGAGSLSILFLRWVLTAEPSRRRARIDRVPWPWSRFGLRRDQMRRRWIFW